MCPKSIDKTLGEGQGASNCIKRQHEETTVWHYGTGMFSIIDFYISYLEITDTQTDIHTDATKNITSSANAGGKTLMNAHHTQLQSDLPNLPPLVPGQIWAD